MQTIHLHNDVNSYIYICQHSSIMQTIHLPIVELTNKGMNLEDWSQNSCNFFAVSDSSTCPDIKTSWCHSDIIEHFKIWVFENDPIGLQWGSKNQKCFKMQLECYVRIKLELEYYVTFKMPTWMLRKNQVGTWILRNIQDATWMLRKNQVGTWILRKNQVGTWILRKNQDACFMQMYRAYCA